MSTEKLVKTPEGRVKRKPFDGRNRLKVKGDKDPNFFYRIANDTEDRIPDLLEAGYVLANDEGLRVGDSRVDATSAVGKTREISVGQGTKAVLLKIPKEYYDEDQAAKEEYHKKTEAAMRPNPNEGGYGKIEITR
jgi:hypothetical protein